MKNFHMKNLSLALFWCFLASVSISTVFWLDNVMDYIHMFDDLEITYWYTTNDHLTIRNVSDSSIDVDSPVIKKGDDNVEGYWFFAATDTWTWIPQVNWCFDTVNIDWNKFSVSLDTEWMFKDTVYYLYAVPISSTVKIWKDWPCSSWEALSWWSMSNIWEVSSVNGDDPCFKISWRLFWKWGECSTVTSSTTTVATTASHTTAQTSNDIASIAWITHTFTGDQITLRWNSLSDEQMEIFYEDPNNLGSFVYLATVNTDDRIYTFTAKFDGDHLIRMAAANGSRSKHYTAHYTRTETPQVTPTVKPPVVWPKENILMVVFGTLILYVVYSVVKRRA